ncbi:thioredoxin-2-like [Anastrepha obliqua]|uniref:thioredoxin-2-like n=1 Tax=Anastrepha obliqua TaxID=95512 RepID=UPI00240945C2|nr:thioredoxin-2-like [Anastrepha obliqua]
MVYIIQNKEDLDKKIEEARSSGQLVVIDFFANWCGPCKIISPKLEELATQYADKAVVVKVNVDDCEEIALEYNVNSMPTFVFIKDNHIIDVFVGGNSEKLVKNMEKYVGEPIPMENMPEIAEAEQILEEEQPVLD